MKKISRCNFVRHTTLGAAGLFITACGARSNGAADAPAASPGAVDTPAASPEVVDAPAVPPSPAPTDTIQLRMGWWGAEARNRLYNEIADIYQQRNPHVTIVREFAGWDDYWIRTATQAAGRNLPDITASVIDTLTEYALRNAYLPLNQFVESGVIDTQGWPQAVLDGVTINDNLYMMPTGTTINSVIINVDMINNAGMEPPPFEMTYDEYRNYVIELQSALPDGVWATSDAMQTWEHFQTWNLQSGYQIANADFTDVGFPRDVPISFFNYWQGLYEAGAVLPIDHTVQPMSDQWAESTLARGLVAMTWQNSNQLKIFQRYTDGDLVLIRNPTMPDGEHMYGEYLRPSGLSMAANTRHPEEVARFINYFVNDPEAIRIFNNEVGAMAPEHAAAVLEDVIDPKDRLVAEYFNIISATPGLAQKMPDPRGTPAVRGAFIRAAQSVRYGTPIEEAADTFMQEATDAYREASE